MKIETKDLLRKIRLKLMWRIWMPIVILILNSTKEIERLPFYSWFEFYQLSFSSFLCSTLNSSEFSLGVEIALIPTTIVFHMLNSPILHSCTHVSYFTNAYLSFEFEITETETVLWRYVWWIQLSQLPNFRLTFTSHTNSHFHINLLCFFHVCVFAFVQLVTVSVCNNVSVPSVHSDVCAFENRNMHVLCEHHRYYCGFSFVQIGRRIQKQRERERMKPYISSFDAWSIKYGQCMRHSFAKIQTPK